MAGTRKPKVDLPEYTKAMNDAHEEVVQPDGSVIPHPKCDDNPGPYADYGYPLPTQAEAEALCEGCWFYEQLNNVCLRNGKHRAPAWGIRGGVAFVEGRQVHLLAHDDPRRADPDADPEPLLSLEPLTE